MYLFILIVIIIACGYFAFRYFSLINALKETTMELEDIRKDLSQNRILHLPLPDKHLENLLISMNATLKETHKERQSYGKREKEFQKQIENISHDLRTPLTVILGYLKLIDKSENMLQTDSELAETLQIMKQKAETMESLVSQLYSFSRLGADNYELTIHEVDINRILKETLLGSYQILEKSGISVNTALPDTVVWVWGEETALERVFSNLLQNAGRYANSFLNIYLEEAAGKVIVHFENDAKGLSEHDILHLFDRFYMQDNSRHQGGTGLGLTIARSLAEKMDGSLRAYKTDCEAPEKTAADNICLHFELCMCQCGKH